MKTLTCRELGGKCDENLSANSWNEMVNAMTRHVMEKHPDVANDMERMHNEDRQKWGGEMKPKFYAALEHQSAVSQPLFPTRMWAIETTARFMEALEA
jgi:predicted small metal-binding protein